MENEVLKEETKTETVVTENAGVTTKAEEVVTTTPDATAKAAEVKKIVVAKALAFKDYVSKMSRTTKSFVVVIVLFAVALGVLYFYKGIFIAATVNGSPISRMSVISELEKKAGKNILDTMITKKLIQDAIKKSGIVVKSEDIDAEMKKIEEQVTAQGGTLDEALTGQGMTLAELREQIVINKELEKILEDKVIVTDDEVTQYLATSKAVPPKGTNSEDMKNQVREQLKGQKFSTEAEKWVSDLKAKAQIDYFIQY
ncbi:MAG: hypothetical protein WCG73_00560 [Candidatus Moraniibacteriota bacterium]